MNLFEDCQKYRLQMNGRPEFIVDSATVLFENGNSEQTDQKFGLFAVSLMQCFMVLNGGLVIVQLW